MRQSTGLITNIDDSNKHECVWDSNYPENPFRLARVIQRFKEYQLYDRCEILKSRPATKEEILIAHSEEAYTLLQNYASSGINPDYHRYMMQFSLMSTQKRRLNLLQVLV